MLTETTTNTERVIGTQNIKLSLESLFAELFACPVSGLVPKVVELSAIMTRSQWSALQNVAEESVHSNGQAARVHVALRHIGLMTY